VTVAVCSALVVEIFGGAGSGDSGEGPDEAQAASRLFFTCRRRIEMLRPEALVMGAAPANALSRGSAKRLRSSPISASKRALVMSPRPGKLVKTSRGHGCLSSGAPNMLRTRLCPAKIEEPLNATTKP